MSTPWTTHGEVSCIAECKRRFLDNCTDVIYNKLSHACTPVYPKISAADPDLAPVGGDTLYTEVFPGNISFSGAAIETTESSDLPAETTESSALAVETTESHNLDADTTVSSIIGACDTSAGFQLQQNTVCVLPISFASSHNDAKVACQLQGGHVFMTNTADKLTVLHSLALQTLSTNDYITVGLTKVDTSWVWEDGASYDPDLNIWDRFQPDNQAGETCTALFTSTGKIHDVSCLFATAYICEQGY